jgi:hypothetical protein
MRKIIIALLLVNLLTACIPGSSEGVDLPKITMSPANKSTQSPSVTPPQTNVPVSSQTGTASLYEFILADFPLAVNATWKYSAEITYQDPEKVGEIETWTGIITDRAIENEKLSDGRQVFRIEETTEPLPPEAVWRQPGTFEYILSDDQVYKGDRKIYQWPLSDRLTWEYIPGYLAEVDYIGVVKSGNFNWQNCSMISIITNADTTIDTFCSQVGFVEHFYKHHGTTQDEHFILQEFIPGD